MELELSLFELCQMFICVLEELKEKSLISEEEYKAHSKKKNEFIQFYNYKNKLQ